MTAELQRDSFEYHLGTLVLGVDTLWGGNVSSPSGLDHFIADNWISGAPFPEVMNDPFAATLRADGAGVLTKKDQGDAVSAFVEKYGLDTLPNTLRMEIHTIHDADRATYLRNLVSSLEVMRDRAMAEVGLCDTPSYELMYRTAMKQEVTFPDPAPYRKQLRSALARFGFETTTSRDLSETLLAWQAAQKLAQDDVPTTVARLNRELLQRTRQELLAKIRPSLPGYAPDLSDVAFNGMEFKTLPEAFFTGSLAYFGGEDNGKPLLRGLYEFNIQHTGTKSDMLHLCSHEMMPGHYLSATILDLLWRANRLGFEATIGTLGTPETVFLEGWAENAFPLLYGSREKAIDAYGPALAVVFACCDLESLGKHNASVLYNRDRISVEELQRKLAKEYAQPPALVKKLSGIFVRHPILGPMYAPAYLVGTAIVADAIAAHGSLPVARVGMYLDGIVDIQTFQRKLEK